MTAQHTPGPWLNKGSGLVENQDVLIEIYGGNREANAHLIAAAPELLKALEHAHALITALKDGGHAINADSIIDMYAAAIAKAKGE